MTRPLTLYIDSPRDPSPSTSFGFNRTFRFVATVIRFRTRASARISSVQTSRCQQVIDLRTGVVGNALHTYRFRSPACVCVRSVRKTDLALR